MRKLIRPPSNEEGVIINRWLENRLKRNKNVLAVTTGPTGSSKSYQDLRKAELWYRYYFNEDFPAENICFSIAEVMERLSSGKLRKGDILILEESGINLGSLDFQNRISKLFTYVLQSFRSLNIIVLFNLPYLSMLNKSARLLIHVQFVTCGIDFQKKIAKSKAYFRQINQDSGKVYNKFMRIKIGRMSRTIKKFNFSLPSKRLQIAYERKKANFISEFTQEFTKQTRIAEQDKVYGMRRKTLTIFQLKTYKRYLDGYTYEQIAKEDGVSIATIKRRLDACKKKGYSLEKPTK